MQQTPITLTAAELYVLRDLDGSTGREAFKMALTELLMRGVIRFHREQTKVLWIFPKQENYLVVVHNMRINAGNKTHITAVLDVVAGAQKQPLGARMENVIRDARRGRFGKDLASYKTEYVLPSLVREGMVTTQQEKKLGFLTRTKYVRTQKGQDTMAELNDLTQRAQELPEMAKQHPREALGLLSLMGAGLILMPEMRSHYGELGASLGPARRRAEVGAASDTGSVGDDGSGGGEGGVPFPDLAAQFEAGYAGLLDSFDGAAEAFDSVLDSFDADFDSAGSGDGGGDGGDGGGGDGGGDGGGGD